MKKIFYYTADKKNIPNRELPIASINHDDTSSSWYNAGCVRLHRLHFRKRCGSHAVHGRRRQWR